MSRFWGIPDFEDAISANNRLKYQLSIVLDDFKIIMREVKAGTFDEQPETVVNEMIVDINSFADTCENYLDCSAAIDIIRDMGKYSKPISIELILEDLVGQTKDAIDEINADIESCEESMNYLELNHIYD